MRGPTSFSGSGRGRGALCVLMLLLPRLTHASTSQRGCEVQAFLSTARRGHGSQRIESSCPSACSACPQVSYREFDFGHLDFTFAVKEELKRYLLQALSS